MYVPKPGHQPRAVSPEEEPAVEEGDWQTHARHAQNEEWQAPMQSDDHNQRDERAEVADDRPGAGDVAGLVGQLNCSHDPEGKSEGERSEQNRCRWAGLGHCRLGVHGEDTRPWDREIGDAENDDHQGADQAEHRGGGRDSPPGSLSVVTAVCVRDDGQQPEPDAEVQRSEGRDERTHLQPYAVAIVAAVINAEVPADKRNGYQPRSQTDEAPDRRQQGRPGYPTVAFIRPTLRRRRVKRSETEKAAPPSEAPHQ